MKILCSISTRGRYYTTLPLAIQSAINQTRKVDKLVVYDDNDEPKDLRSDSVYSNLFEIMNLKGIQWEWVFSLKRGQHFNHQMANTAGHDLVWRLDDDNIAEPDVLKTLEEHFDESVGAVGGSILVPTWECTPRNASGEIENIDIEPNIQWGYIEKLKEVDHLHCSFLYRAGVHDYNLNLSRVAHREETLFTYGLKQKGYRNLVVPDCITWHLKSPEGGIRSENIKELYDQDDAIFRNLVKFKDKTIVVLDNGMGDHIVFKRVLPLIKNPVLFTCYPEIIPGRSIQEAKDLFGDLTNFNIYQKMAEWNWKDSLENAYKKLYGVK